MKAWVPVKSRRMPRAGVRGGVTTVHHVVSRVCGQSFLLTDEEKEAFRGLLRRVAGFCGVEVITYALLDNHFHLLVEVPGSVGELSDEELLGRARLLYGKERKGQPLSMARIEGALRSGGEGRGAMRGLLMGRMAALPMFMKILKQRYSILFNRKYDRVGTLWEGRFRSVLVEDTRLAVRAVAAYIDLNAVRAGIVRDPKDYRFSGYGESVGGGRLTSYAVWRRIADNRADPPEVVAARYRQYLFLIGSDPRKGGTVSADDAMNVKAQGGRLSGVQQLRCRVRYMTCGAIIGSKAFVQKWMCERRGGSTGGARTSGPVPAAGFGDEGLYSASKRA